MTALKTAPWTSEPRSQPLAPREVKYVDLAAQYVADRDGIHQCLEQVFRHGELVGGPEIAAFESEMAAFCQVRHAIALNSGTDALILAMRATGIGPGDEVITPPNSFVASTAAIVAVGAVPVFVDVLDDQNIDPDAVAGRINKRTKAIMPVHLTGRIAQMAPITALAARHDLVVIEDAAQAVGSRYCEQLSGAIGHVGCISTHPLKNLNAAGDGGILTTDDDAVAERVRRLRSHGLQDRDTVAEWGSVSRMDTLQAAILSRRLAQLPDVIEKRRHNAALYGRLLDASRVFWPKERAEEFNTYHTFVIQVDERDALRRHLSDHGIGTAIHYPVPIHLQPAAEALGHGVGDFPVVERQAERILSLPVHQFLSDDDVDYVADCVNGYVAKAGGRKE